MSNDQNGISSNSQRKIVRTENGIFHIVYESQGCIWYSRSLTTNFNGDWSKDLLIGCSAKNPAIDYLENKIYLVYEHWKSDENILSLQYLVINTENMVIEYQTSFYISSSIIDFGLVKPVVAIVNRYNQSIIIYKKSIVSNLKYRIRTYYENNWHWSPEQDIPYTNSNSKNPSVAASKHSAGEFFIAYQQGDEVIRYIHADYKDVNYLRFCDSVSVSVGSGFEKNYYPSISVFSKLNSTGGYDFTPIISWTGYTRFLAEKSANKDNSLSPHYSSAVVRTRSGIGWGSFFVADNDVGFTVNNSNLSNNPQTIIAWSRLDWPHNNRWVKRENDSYGPINNLSHKGKQIQLSNGISFNTIKAYTFNTNTTTPYLINLSTTNFATIQKDNFSGLSKIGRAATIPIDSYEIIFAINNIKVNGSSIDFVEHPDTLPVTSLEELNSKLVSKNFQLNRNSVFTFSILYYSIKKNLEQASSKDFGFLNVKVELVNAFTNQVIKIFDNLKLSKNKLKLFNAKNYNVNCSKITPGYYFLRINIDAELDTNLYLANWREYASNLEKFGFIEIDLDQDIYPTDNNLEQNYPNPFNPTTKIRYSVKEDKLVTIKLYDMLGREVSTLLNEVKSPGEYVIELDAQRLGLSSGVYLYQMKSGEFSSIKKLVFVK